MTVTTKNFVIEDSIKKKLFTYVESCVNDLITLTFSSHVRTDSRYGTKPRLRLLVFSAKDAITFPNVSNDLLIDTPSFGVQLILLLHE